MRVEWEDAWSSSGWRADRDCTACPVESVGYVLNHTKKGILLAGSLTKNEDVNVAMAGRQGFIPSGNILKIKVLK